MTLTEDGLAHTKEKLNDLFGKQADGHAAKTTLNENNLRTLGAEWLACDHPRQTTFWALITDAG